MHSSILMQDDSINVNKKSKIKHKLKCNNIVSHKLEFKNRIAYEVLDEKVMQFVQCVITHYKMLHFRIHLWKIHYTFIFGVTNQNIPYIFLFHSIIHNSRYTSSVISTQIKICG